MTKNVEIDSEDYEVIPLSPIRKLEERIRRIEKEREGIAYESFIREILELIQSNQKLVDEIVKANDELREELAKIPGKIDEMLKAWREFIEILKEVGSTEATASSLTEQFNKLVEQNKEMLEAIRSLKARTRTSALGTIETGPSKYPKIRIKRT